MKRYLSIVISVVLFGALVGVGSIFFNGVNNAAACGWGSSGGGDYVPQRRDATGFLASKPALNEEQARDIVTNYVKRLNPDLKIGPLKDNGGFYEAEILSEDNEIVQVLGVDKRSGRLILLN
jgi:hypothetical protein